MTSGARNRLTPYDLAINKNKFKPYSTSIAPGHYFSLIKVRTALGAKAVHVVDFKELNWQRACKIMKSLCSFIVKDHTVISCYFVNQIFCERNGNGN